MQDADCCPRSLAILIRAVSPGLLLRLLPVIVSMVCSVRRFQAGDVTPTATFQLETDIERHLRELGRVIMEWTLNQLEPDDPGLLPAIPGVAGFLLFSRRIGGGGAMAEMMRHALMVIEHWQGPRSGVSKPGNDRCRSDSSRPGEWNSGAAHTASVASVNAGRRAAVREAGNLAVSPEGTCPSGKPA